MAHLYDPVPDSVREQLYYGIAACVDRGVSFEDMRRTVLQAWADIWQEKAAHAAKDAANSWPK